MYIPTKLYHSPFFTFFASGIPRNVPQKYRMLSKNDNGVVLMPENEQTLVDASVTIIDRLTIMEFTKTMKETGQIEITPGKNKLLWTHGSSDALRYHRSRSQFVLNLSSGLLPQIWRCG